MAVTVIPAQLRHVELIVGRMRPRDVQEIEDSHGERPGVAMAHALFESYRAITMLHGLVPLCMVGLAPAAILTGMSRLWIFGTDEIDKVPFAFARASRVWAAWLLADVRIATNFIAADDLPALKWMEWCGGKLLPGERIRGGRRFRQFVIENRNAGSRACLRA